jgi:hypothetical protein
VAVGRGTKTGRVVRQVPFNQEISRRGHHSGKSPEPAATVLRDRERRCEINVCSGTSEVQLKSIEQA